MQKNIAAIFLCFNLYAISVAPVGGTSDMWSGILAYSNAMKNACVGPSGICTLAMNFAMTTSDGVYQNVVTGHSAVRNINAWGTTALEHPVKLASAEPTTPAAKPSLPMPSWCEENSYAPEQSNLPVVQEMNELCAGAQARSGQ